MPWLVTIALEESNNICGIFREDSLERIHLTWVLNYEGLRRLQIQVVVILILLSLGSMQSFEVIIRRELL